jgi:hypothetical protein
MVSDLSDWEGVGSLVVDISHVEEPIAIFASKTRLKLRWSSSGSGGGGTPGNNEMEQEVRHAQITSP